MKKAIIFSLTAFLFLAGCMNEPYRDCSGRIRLEFIHTINTAFEDRLREEVRNIQVYVFDNETGILVDIVPVNQSAVQRGYVDLVFPNSGRYTLLAWGASSDNTREGGHKTVETVNATAYEYVEGARIGETTLWNFRKKLEYEEVARSGNSGQRTFVPRNAQFDNLFHAKVADIPVRLESQQTVVMDLMRNTSVLRIEVVGLEYLQMILGDNPLQVFVTGNNARYHTDNDICSRASELLFLPRYREVTDFVKQLDIYIHRLIIETHLDNPGNEVILWVQHPVTGMNLIRPLNLMRAILSVRDPVTGDLVWQTQDDIDREEEYTIRISFFPHDLNVGVSIKGWNVGGLSPIF